VHKSRLEFSTLVGHSNHKKVTGSAKTRHGGVFLNTILLNIQNLTKHANSA